MVLLHHRVVPGLGDGVRFRPEAVAVDADRWPCADRDLAPVEATSQGPPRGPAGTPAAIVAAASAAESTRAA